MSFILYYNKIECYVGYILTVMYTYVIVYITIVKMVMVVILINYNFIDIAWNSYVIL